MHAEFKEYVNKVITMGFCPSGSTFMNALRVISEIRYQEDELYVAYQSDNL